MRRVSEHRKKKKEEEARVKQHIVHSVLRGFYNVLYCNCTGSGVTQVFTISSKSM